MKQNLPLFKSESQIQRVTMNEPSDANVLNQVLKLSEEVNELLNIRNSFSKILENTIEEVAFSKFVDKNMQLYKKGNYCTGIFQRFSKFENTLRWLLPE